MQNSKECPLICTCVSVLDCFCFGAIFILSTSYLHLIIFIPIHNSLNPFESFLNVHTHSHALIPTYFHCLQISESYPRVSNSATLKHTYIHICMGTYKFTYLTSSQISDTERLTRSRVARPHFCLHQNHSVFYTLRTALHN